MLILSIIIFQISLTKIKSVSTPCNVDLQALLTYAATGSTSQIFLELSGAMVGSVEECMSMTPPTGQTCCAGTLTPLDNTLIYPLTSIIICLQTSMNYTFQAYFDGIKEKFSLIKNLEMNKCINYGYLNCAGGNALNAEICSKYQLNPEESGSYDSCCLMNYDEKDGSAAKKCFAANKKDIDSLKQAVKDMKNQGYKGVVVDCFQRYLKLEFWFSLFLVFIVF